MMLVIPIQKIPMKAMRKIDQDEKLQTGRWYLVDLVPQDAMHPHLV